MLRNKLLLFFAVPLCLLLGREASAAIRTTTQSGNWSATTTWGGNPAPVTGDAVIVNGNFTVTVDVPNAQCLSLQLGGSTLGTGAGTVAFNAGSQLAVAGPVILGVTNNTPGSVNMAAGGTLACEGLVDNRLGTWTPGAGTVVFTATNTIPTNNNIDFNNLTVSAGSTSLSRNMSVNGNLVINAGGTLVCGANVLTCLGDWTNNGTFTGGTGQVTFARNGNQTIAGTGANNFNTIRLNMGLSLANTLEVTSSSFSAAPGFLQLSNGTFKLSGTFPFANTFVIGPAYNIGVTSGLWLNNPNATVTGQNGSVSVRGLLRVSAGTFEAGTLADGSLNYQNNGSVIIVDGGAVKVAGRLCGNNATATTTYTQTGGTVTVVGAGSTDPVFAGFDLRAAGSSFTMSGGTIVVRNATSAPVDFLNSAGASSVTGGVLQVGDAQSGNAQIVRVQSGPQVGALVVSNATTQATKPTARIVGASLNTIGGVTITTGATLDANGFNLVLGGDWTDSGTFLGANTVTFNGAGGQSLTRPGGETFASLTVAKPAGTLTLASSATVDGSANLVQGTIAVGANTLTLNGAVSGGAALTSALAGTVAYNQAGAGQSVLAGGYGQLTFSNFDKVLASTGTIGVAGSFNPGTATGHTVTGSTIDFNGASQSVPAFAYHHLVLSGSGTKSATGTLSVAGNLTNNAGVTFAGAALLSLNGATHTNGGTLSAATLSLAPAATLTNNGTATFGSALSGAGTFTQGASGVLHLGGSTTVGALNATAAGNTVDYSGAGQTLAPVAYHHLTLSGSGVPVMTGVGTINGDFTLSGTASPIAGGALAIGGTLVVGPGASLGLGSFTHTLAGNWSVAGSVTPGTSTVALNGTAAQNLSGGSFAGLAIDNVAGASMATDETIDAALTLTNGTLSIGAHTLRLNGAISPGAGSLVGGASSSLVVGGSSASTAVPALALGNFTLDRPNGASLSGDVNVTGTLTITNGSLQTGANAAVLGSSATLSEQAGKLVVGNVRTTRVVSATSGTETFGGIGADVTLNGVALGSTTVRRRTGTASTGAGHSSITRWFDITPTTNTGLNAGLVFHYDASEVGAQNPAALELYRSRDNGSTWNDLGGVANAPARTITVSGIDDFSRWTAADTSNRIGNAPTPATASLSPASKNAGDAAFTLTVNGTEFVNGKSVVRWNGSSRPTTFVSPTRLTAAIPASDLLLVGPVPVTVFNTGGGTSNAQTFTVNTLPPSQVRVETAADGSGTVVPAQSLASGTSVTVFAIARDPLNNFVSNVASTWALGALTGGVVAGDLVPAVDGRSAVFTAHVVGSANVQATSGALTPTPSGTLTVTPGAASRVRVETLANGAGVVVPAQALASGASLTVFAIARDASNNFVANVAATAWSLPGATGGVVAGDLVPAVDARSAVFTGHVVGTAAIQAASAALATTPSGTLTVTPGAASKVRVETLANGSGVVVPAQSLSAGTALTVFSITRDASNNFVANVAASSWSLGGATGGVVAGDLVPAADAKSAAFTAHAVGTTTLQAASGALTATPSGVLTVTPGVAVSVRVETAANGTGVVVPAQSLASGASLTVFAVTRDASNNFLANVAASSWTLGGATGGVVAGDLVPAVDARSAVFTAHAVGGASIQVASGATPSVPSGTLTVTPGPAATVRVETLANGTGLVVPAQTLSAGSTLTVFAVTRDASNNFVANVAASAWSLAGSTGGVVAGDLVPAPDAKSAVFTAHAVGTTSIRATSGALLVTPSGTVTVGANAATRVAVETAADGSGTVVPAQSLVAGTPITVFAIARDGLGNFVGNVAASTWALGAVTGGVVAADLVPAADTKSAVFTAHAVGSARIQTTSGALPSTPSGTLTVTVGAAVVVRVETAADGSGTVVPAQSLQPGHTLTVFAVTRDVANNFLGNVAATAWALGNVTGGVSPSDLVASPDGRSAVLTGSGTGTCGIFAITGGLPSVGSGTITVAGVLGAEPAGPLSFALQQNFPNPFVGSTTMRFEVPRSTVVSLKVFDVLGREVATLANGVTAAGRYTVRWDARGLKSGTYFARLESEGRRQVRKILVAR